MLGQTGRFAAVGLEMGMAVVIGILGGRYLYGKFDTAPVFFWIGFSLGVGAAFKALFQAARKARKTLETNESSPDSQD